MLAICRRLQEAGFPCVLVGGAVRDLLRGRTPQDWDLATGATPQQVQHLFQRVVPTGLAFGTVTVMDFQFPCEVTSFRTEGDYRDGRHPSWVRVGATLEEDLSRRDFTINAMAYDPLARRLIDPFHGRADLQQGLIRAVGSPDERFQEDPLRILRALRIASEEGFRIEEGTRAAIARQAEGLRRISGERIGAEMSRLLVGTHVREALLAAARLGVMAVLAPECPEWAAGQSERPLALIIQAVAAAPPRLAVRLAALGHRCGEGEAVVSPCEGSSPSAGSSRSAGTRSARPGFAAVLERWRLPKALSQQVLELIAHHRHPAPCDKTLRRWLARSGPQWVEDLLSLMEAVARAQEDPSCQEDPSSQENPSWLEDPPAGGEAATVRDSTTAGGPPRLGSLQQARQRLARILAEEPILGPHDLALDGRDIMQILGLEPGPEVGRWKEALYEYVLEDPRRNTPGTLRAWLLRQGNVTQEP